ncbi:MAG: hypothetical protein Q7S37_05440 [bacterium]|nr:hypothetical protein [bacterium]
MKYLKKILIIMAYLILVIFATILTMNGIIIILNLLGNDYYFPLYAFNLPLDSLLESSSLSFVQIVQIVIGLFSTIIGLHVFHKYTEAILDNIRFFTSDFYIIQVASPKTSKMLYSDLLPSDHPEDNEDINLEESKSKKKTHKKGETHSHGPEKEHPSPGVSISSHPLEEPKNKSKHADEPAKSSSTGPQLDKTDDDKITDSLQEDEGDNKLIRSYSSTDEKISQESKEKEPTMPLITAIHEESMKTVKVPPKQLMPDKEGKSLFDEDRFVRTLKLFSSFKLPWKKQKEDSKDKKTIHKDID